MQSSATPESTQATTPAEQVEVQQQPVASVKQEICKLLNRTRERVQVDVQRFAWLYEENPDGLARVWVARDVKSGDLAGFAAVLPRRMWVNGEEVMAWNCSDLSVSPDYRRQGIASRLRLAAHQEVTDGAVSLLYGHPNQRAEGAHIKAGNHRLGSMVRYAKPLQVRHYCARLLGSWAARLVPQWLDRWLTHSPAECEATDLQLQVDAALEFGEEYDQLFRRAVAGLNRPIVGVRDAKYLNWRYAKNPLERLQRITAARNGQMVGYLLFSQEESTAAIRDVFYDDQAVLTALLSELVRYGRSQSWQGLSFVFLESFPGIECVQRFGFRQRADRSTMFTCCQSGFAHQSAAENCADWYLTVGDRDV